jgi:recyclin-1
MVYDDTRWVHKLRLIGVWSELEARRRLDDAMRRKRAIQEARALVDGKVLPSKDRSMIFDAAEEERRRVAAARLLKEEEARMKAVGVSGPPELIDGLQLLSVQAGEVLDISTAAFITSEEALVVLDRVRSIRGLARYEFARVYGALGGLYHDLVRARTHNDPVLFKRFRDPQQQAKMLSQLKRFSESDTAYGWMERQERLESMMGIFENAALAEFEK